MSASHDTYTRQQGQKKTYDVEYTALRYKISLDGKVLKNIELPIKVGAIHGADDVWTNAVRDIEYLRGMPEA
ncbi:hypothetical protein [Pseudoduganella sp. RAF53_2]|jgi:phage tail tube protein FII|uniref:hypothetical protein n=1 Tax=unclassified Pseudoduganella TaxID=2637179 RepID=UPI003F9594C4